MDMLDDWTKGRAAAKTPAEKSAYNVWDNLMTDVLPILRKALVFKWSWWKNPDCKYIDVRIDMRTGHCIIKNNKGERINPEDLAYQRSSNRSDVS